MSNPNPTGKHCWNPFGKCTSRYTALRRLSSKNTLKFEFVPENAVICLNCRLAVDKYEPVTNTNLSSTSSDNDSEPFGVSHRQEILNKVNTVLLALDQSKIDGKRLYNKKYVTRKAEAAQETIKERLENISNMQISTSNDDKVNAFDEIMTSLQQFICSVSSEKCYKGLCKSCPNKTHLKNKLLEGFDDESFDDVTYKQWIATDRCTLKTLTDTKGEFVSSLMDKLPKLLYHDFVATEQAQYFKDCKNNLQNGELLVTLDFSENFAFVVQEAVQGFHWNNNQATIHPIVIYYRNQETSEVDHISYVGISDCLEHDTIAVYMFQRKLIEHLKDNFTSTKSIKYFSDGAPQQYKNKKNFINLMNHSKDFSIAAEWNFFATAHGKGACDGVGGTLKRTARRYCLQKGTKDEILTAAKLFEWAKKHAKSYKVFFCSKKDYEESADYLKSRFETCKTVKGTLGIHHIAAINNYELKFKTTSNSLESKVVRF